MRGYSSGFLAGDDEHGLLVAECPLGAHDGGAEVCVQDAPGIGQEQFHAFAQAACARQQGAEPVAEILWKHGDDTVNEVGGVPTELRLFVEG